MIYIINNTSLSARLAPKHTLMQDARLQDCKIWLPVSSRRYPERQTDFFSRRPELTPQAGRAGCPVSMTPAMIFLSANIWRFQDYSVSLQHKNRQTKWLKITTKSVTA